MLRGDLPVHWPSLVHPQNHCQRGVQNVNSVAAPNHKKLVSRQVAPFSRLQLRFPSEQKTVRIEGLAQGFLVGPPLGNGGGFWHVLCTTVGSGSENKKERR